MNTDKKTLWWLVDEQNDWEGETFGMAVRQSPEMDAAMLKWANSYAEFHSDGGGSMHWRSGFTEEQLDGMCAGSGNTYSSRVHFLDYDQSNVTGTIFLLDCLDRHLIPGETLILYKGNLDRVRMVGDRYEDERLADMFDFCASGDMSEDDAGDEEWSDDPDAPTSHILVKYEESIDIYGALTDVFVCTRAEYAGLLALGTMYLPGRQKWEDGDINATLNQSTLTILSDDPDVIETCESAGVCVGCKVYELAVDAWREYGEVGEFEGQISAEDYAALTAMYPPKPQETNPYPVLVLGDAPGQVVDRVTSPEDIRKGDVFTVNGQEWTVMYSEPIIGDGLTGDLGVVLWKLGGPGDCETMSLVTLEDLQGMERVRRGPDLDTTMPRVGDTWRFEPGAPTWRIVGPCTDESWPFSGPGPCHSMRYIAHEDLLHSSAKLVSRAKQVAPSI